MTESNSSPLHLWMVKIRTAPSSEKRARARAAPSSSSRSSRMRSKVCAITSSKRLPRSYSADRPVKTSRPSRLRNSSASLYSSPAFVASAPPWCTRSRASSMCQADVSSKECGLDQLVSLQGAVLEFVEEHVAIGLPHGIASDLTGSQDLDCQGHHAEQPRERLEHSRLAGSIRPEQKAHRIQCDDSGYLPEGLEVAQPQPCQFHDVTFFFGRSIPDGGDPVEARTSPTPPGQRSSGLRPVLRAMRASMAGPISSPSWKDQT